MSSDDTSRTDSHVSADPDQVERWSEDHGLVPVRHTGGGEDRIELVPESEESTTDHERLEWSEFHSELQRGDVAVVKQGEEKPSFDVLQRDELTGRAALDDHEVEQALEAGETVTTTMTETTVVEKTVVEEVTVESEVVDRTMVESTIVDAELINRDVDHCSVTGLDELSTEARSEYFETGYRMDESVDVEVEIDEGWTVTREVMEELLIESRVVDTDATETDTIESDRLEETVDVGGVERQILEGELVSSPETESVIDRGAIESEVVDDVVQTTLIERNTVEDEISLRREFTGEIADGTTTSVETITSETIESEIVDRDDIDAEVMTEGAIIEEEGMTATEETATTDETTAESGAVEMEGQAPIPSDADEGKTVVDADGEEVGMVVDVEENTIYVDPHPSLTDRIRTALNWGDHDEDTYPLDADHVDDITDDEVRLAVEE